MSAVADVAAWQRHSDAAIDAFVKSDTAEAEKKFKAAITEAEGLNPDTLAVMFTFGIARRIFHLQRT